MKISNDSATIRTKWRKKCEIGMNKCASHNLISQLAELGANKLNGEKNELFGTKIGTFGFRRNSLQNCNRMRTKEPFSHSHHSCRENRNMIIINL